MYQSSNISTVHLEEFKNNNFFWCGNKEIKIAPKQILTKDSNHKKSKSYRRDTAKLLHKTGSKLIEATKNLTCMVVSEKRRLKASLSQREENNIAQLSTGDAIDTEDRNKPKTTPKKTIFFKEKGKGVRAINKNVNTQKSGE